VVLFANFPFRIFSKNEILQIFGKHSQNNANIAVPLYQNNAIKILKLNFVTLNFIRGFIKKIKK
jgi:hypothetical protein